MRGQVPGLPRDIWEHLPGAEGFGLVGQRKWFMFQKDFLPRCPVIRGEKKKKYRYLVSHENSTCLRGKKCSI